MVDGLEDIEKWSLARAAGTTQQDACLCSASFGHARLIPICGLSVSSPNLVLQCVLNQTKTTAERIVRGLRFTHMIKSVQGPTKCHFKLVDFSNQRLVLCPLARSTLGCQLLRLLHRPHRNHPPAPVRVSFTAAHYRFYPHLLPFRSLHTTVSFHHLLPFVILLNGELLLLCRTVGWSRRTSVSLFFLITHGLVPHSLYLQHFDRTTR